jgi:hypothetical protein
MKDRVRSAGKKPYAPPRLTVYGELRALTQAKRGTRNDGGGKPRTRSSGGSA